MPTDGAPPTEELAAMNVAAEGGADKPKKEKKPPKEKKAPKEKAPQGAWRWREGSNAVVWVGR